MMSKMFLEEQIQERRTEASVKVFQSNNEINTRKLKIVKFNTCAIFLNYWN